MASTLPTERFDVKPGTLFVGVDLALDRHVAVVLDGQRKRLDRFGFANTREGFDFFHQRVTGLCQRCRAPGALIGMEPTNSFWKPLAAELERRSQPYCLVNPYTVKKHREGDQLDRSRDDNRDARKIAELVCSGTYTKTSLLHGAYAELREYVTLYHRLRKDLTRQKTVIWALAEQVFPELTTVFPDLSTQTALAMLTRHASAAVVRQMPLEAFLAGVRADFQGKRLSATPLQQAHALAATSVGLREGLNALQFALTLHIQTLRHLQEQQRQVCQALALAFSVLPEAKYLRSMPGLGFINAATILAEIGDPCHYTNAQQLVKLAGIQPTPNTSGRKQRSLTPMSHQGRPRLRTALYLAVLSLIRVDPAFQRRYQRLCQRQQNPLTKMQALGALMTRLVRIVWTLIHTPTTYNQALA